MKTLQLTCKCGVKYTTREADIKRGWGKSCSKRCAAIKRTKQELSGNHKMAEASARYRDREQDFGFGGKIWNECSEDQSWDAHK